MPDPIRIEVTISEEDYMAAVWTMARMKSHRQSRVIPRTCVAAIAIGLFLCFLSSQGEGESVLGGALLFLFGGVVLFTWVSQAHRAVGRGWQEYARSAEPANYEFSPTGVAVTTSSVAAQYRWTAFERVQTSADVFLLFRSSGQPIILPKRCFADDAERQSFAQLVREQLPTRTRAFPVLTVGRSPGEVP
jgi:hypothetical protein